MGGIGQLDGARFRRVRSESDFVGFNMNFAYHRQRGNASTFKLGLF